jgi:hypothetical protein
MSQEFCFNKMNQLYENGNLKDHLDCKNYISNYFHPLNNGTHAFIENNTISIIQDETMNKVYLQRFKKDIKAWYRNETIPKKIICDINKPTVGTNFINVGKQLKHKYCEYKHFEKEIRENVKTMLSYIKEVWANNDEKVYQYMLKWLSNMVKGNKNKTCIYAKSLQGAGKSTLPEFIRDHVIGRDITCKGKADHLKGQHNLQLLGRIFVYFEELQIFNDKEWYAVDSELKDMITDDWGSYTDKYEKRFEAQNINNYMIVTNSNLKGVNGRRYLVCDLSSKRLDDFKYYGNLRNKCFNDIVGHAFYCYLMEINVDNFNSLDMPETKNKLAIISELLPPIEKFLKFNFVLRNASINMKLKDLWMQYKEFDHGKSENVSIQRFSEQMRELGFEYSKQDGYSTYKISIDELNNIAKKRKWLHELDKDLLMKPTNDDNECMFIDKTDKAEYIRAEDHKIVLDKLKKFEQSNNDMKNDLTDMMKYISQLEKYVYKIEESNDDEASNEIDVDDEIDVDVDEVVDEASNETDVYENMVTEDELRFVKWFDTNKDYSRDWDKNLKIVQDIKKRLFNQENNINECMFKNHKKKSKQSKQSNEEDDVDIDETEVQSKDIDFVEIATNVYLNKKTNLHFK